MYKVAVRELIRDTKELYEEYLKEDKHKYKQLFSRYFHDIEHYSIYSDEFLDNTIRIDVERYLKVETFFYSCNVDLNAHAEQLRQVPIIREMTKLCFYIEDTLGTFNTIDNDLKELKDL
jgi:hypothetical protein